MFCHPSLARVRALPTLVVATAALLASGCTKAPPDQPDAKLTIAATPLVGSYQPGDDVSFRVTVSNIGTQDVTRVSVTTTLGANVHERSVACSPLGQSADSNVPATCFDSVYLAGLAKGASITFDIVTTLDAHAQGTITNTFTASVLAGPAPVTASNSATIVDARSGAYTAFTSDGHQLDVAADFAGDTLSFSGNGAGVSAPFTLQSGSSVYLTGSQTGFLAQHDLLAGTAPLDGGTPVFIASRAFISILATLDGRTFNTFEIDTPATGAPTSHFKTTAFSGSTMQVCADLAPHTIATCPAASLRHYDVTLAGDVFTGVDAADTDTVTFKVAQSNGTLVLLRAEPTSTGRVFQVGLSSNDGIDPNVLQGGDTTGRWGSLTLNPGTLQENWTQPAVSEYNDQVAPIANAPGGLAVSTVAAPTGSQVYLAEDGDIAILMGQPGSAVDGLLQLFAY